MITTNYDNKPFRFPTEFTSENIRRILITLKAKFTSSSMWSNYGRAKGAIYEKFLKLAVCLIAKPYHVLQIVNPS